MIEKIDRYYLEILSIQSLKHKKKPNENLRIELLKKENFDLNKSVSYTHLTLPTILLV